MRAMLIALAMLAVLGCAAVGEEPGAQAEPETHAVATTAAGSDGSINGNPWGWGHRSPAEIYLDYSYKELFCGIAVLIFFLVGLRKHKHDWKPLVIGLFALGLGLLDAALEVREDCSRWASYGGGHPYDWAETIALALWPVITGLAAALAGGLFTVILTWWNPPFRRLEEMKAEEEAEAEAEAETEEVARD